MRDRSITIVRYVNRGSSEVGLRVRPLLRFRGAGELLRESAEMDATTEIRGEVSWVRPVPYLPRLYLRAVGASTRAEPLLVPRLLLCLREGARLRRHRGPLESGRVDLDPSARAARPSCSSPCEEVAADPGHLMEAERQRREVFARTGDPMLDEMARRAEVFLVEGDYRDGTILAGFPWFTDWARDSMIAAPGLAMATGRYGAVARVLNTYAALRRDGLLPNNFAGDQGEPEFNSVDAPLWFILAVEWFARARRDASRPAPLLAAVRSILESYRAGTRLGIAVAGDGLVSASAPGRALTWMDAVVDGEPVTPRAGKAVEVNALWHAALKSAARLERLAEEPARARELESEAWHVARRFNEVFWNGEKENLYDVVGPDGPDAHASVPTRSSPCRLTEDLLPPHRARAVYWTVRRRLLTPFGLRTLDPKDPRYRGTCRGTQAECDLAYHQGTVWPWLLGPFADAHFRVFGTGEESRRAMRLWLAPLRAHLREAGLGSISEIFDGDPPHTPRGCFAQAWSVSEIARIVYTHLQAREGG